MAPVYAMAAKYAMVGTFADIVDCSEDDGRPSEREKETRRRNRKVMSVETWISFNYDLKLCFWP